MNARLILASAAAVAALGVAAASHAEDIRLSYNDLDLSQPTQAKVLDQRIERAARDWCAGDVQTGSLLQPQNCVSIVRQQLIASLPVASRTAYLAARGGTQTAATASATSGT